MGMGLRYGLSALMAVLGGYFIYYEYILHQRVEGLFIGGILVVWAFLRVWQMRRYLMPRPTNSRRR